MTSEEWKKVKEKLENLGEPVNLIIEGYELCLSLERVSTYKNAIKIVINGTFDNEWLIKDCEERRNFIPKKEVPLFYPFQMESMPKDIQIKMKEKKTASYRSHWKNFKLLKKHLIENNETIRYLETS